MSPRRLALVALLTVAIPVWAHVGFVTLSERESVGVTIYNSQDLTLVRDNRKMVFKKGDNALRFAWANTLIDPTSLMPFAPRGVRLMDTTYLLDQGEALLWNFKADSQTSGDLGIQYFTSGLSWRADHVATLTGGGKIRLETWVSVTNQSGEDYLNTRVRLVVGEVRLMERIRDIAERFRNEAAQQPMVRDLAKKAVMEMDDAPEMEMAAPASVAKAARGEGAMRASRPKSVERESLSELHLYSIEGTEDVPNGGGRRMRAFTYPTVDAKDVFRCVDPRGKQPAQRVLSIMNSKDNKMGTQPFPEGTMHLYVERDGQLAYLAQGSAPYTPMGELIETPLGVSPGIFCEAYEKNFKHQNIKKDSLGRIIGWEDVTEREVKLVNGGEYPVIFELRQNLGAAFTTNLSGAKPEDFQTLFYKSELDPRESKKLTYKTIIKRGTLAAGKGGEP